MNFSFLNIISFALIIAGVLTSVFVIRARTKWDRLLGFLMIATQVNMLIIIFAQLSGNSFYLDIALVYILLSFITLIALADYFFEKGGSDNV